MNPTNRVIGSEPAIKDLHRVGRRVHVPNSCEKVDHCDHDGRIESKQSTQGNV